MADVFISYSRRDQAFALQLVDALKQRDSTAWLDQNDVFPTGEFREDIQAGIEEAGAFLFLLSPDSIVSAECGKELDYAQVCGKKLIPVVHRAVDYSDAPKALQGLAWIEDASFDRLLEKVLDALLTDKDDWKQAGRWLRSASEWDKNHKQHSGLLLHGKDLKKAEDWLKKAESWRLEGSNKKPQPLPLHIQFIRESRRATNRFLLTSILALLLLIGFTGAGAFLLLYHDPTLVTTPQDNVVGSLRWAVNNAPSSSTITFASSLAGKTLGLAGDLAIPPPRRLTLQYTGLGKLTISFHVGTIVVDAGASLTLSNLHLLGGPSNSNAVLDNTGQLTLTNSTVSDNTTSGIYGGGIYNKGTLTMTNSTVSSNTLTFGLGIGGGILNAGTITMTNSMVSGNTAAKGSGIYNGGKVSMTNSTVSGNTTTYGGGIYNDTGTVLLSNSTVSDNTAANGGGGGGIYNDSGTVTLTNSTISDNMAPNNVSGGGGILNTGTMTLSNSTVSGNTTSADQGGGIYNGDYGKMMLTNSTISGNTASNGGGGIYNIGGTVTLTFCTLFGNQDATDGGGLVTEDDTIQSVIQPTLVPAHSTIQNSLIAGNGAPQHPDIAGKLTSQGYNLIQNEAEATFTPTREDRFVSDLSHVFVSNVHLGNNGGPTQTLALLADPNNPARSAIPLASCQIKDVYDEQSRMYIDQRGMIRPGNKKTTCDIGAYETQM